MNRARIAGLLSRGNTPAPISPFAALALLTVITGSTGCVEDALRVKASRDVERAVCHCPTIACATAMATKFEQQTAGLSADSAAEIEASEARMQACVERIKKEAPPMDPTV